MEKPDIADVFGDTAGGQRFIGFCHLYFKIATALGGFQELGRMYFDIMRDSMFAEEGRKVKLYLYHWFLTFISFNW